MKNSYKRIVSSQENVSNGSASDQLQTLLDVIVGSNKEEVWRSLQGDNDSVNMRDVDGNTPLLRSIKDGSPRMFKYLLNLRSTQIDLCNPRNGLSALTMAVMFNREYYALKLIKRGANVNTVDNQGCTPLHYAAKFGSDKLCKVLIRNRAEINVRNLSGETPLHVAYQYGNTERVCMLLYYGANPLIPCNRGNIPLFMNLVDTHNAHLRVSLHYYMLDDKEVTIEMKVLVRAMVLNSPLFPKMMEKVSKITYDEADLHYLNESLPDITPGKFKAFLEKFDHIVSNMLHTCCTMSSYLIAIESLRRKAPEFIDFLYILLESRHLALEAVQSCCRSFPVVASLVKIFHQQRMPLKALTELVCCLFSYGLNVTPTDLNAVYIFHGHCELFRIMLHMDVEPTDNNPSCIHCDYYEFEQESAMAHFIYDIHLNIDKLLKSPQWLLLKDLDVLLNYFALPKLKDFCSMDRFQGHTVGNKAAKLPTVPCLIELSRNAAREFIIKRYQIQNCRQFYTVMKYLPVNNVYKKILTYEKKLYHL